MSSFTPDRVLDALLQLQLDEAKLRAFISSKLAVTNIDALALQHVSHAERDGRILRVGDLRPLLGISRASATVLVGRLQDAGYLTKSTQPTDRRSRTIALTDRTRTELDNALHPAQEAIRDVLEQLDDLQRHQLAQLLSQFSAAITAPLNPPAKTPDDAEA